MRVSDTGFSALAWLFGLAVCTGAAWTLFSPVPEQLLLFAAVCAIPWAVVVWGWRQRTLHRSGLVQWVGATAWKGVAESLHDMGNPLHVLQHTLEDRPAPLQNEATTEYFRRIERASNRLNEVFSSTRSLVRCCRHEDEPMPTDRFLALIPSVLRTSVGEGRPITISDGAVTGDCPYAGRVLKVLIYWASLCGPSQGALTVSAKQTTDRLFLELSFETPSQPSGAHGKVTSSWQAARYWLSEADTAIHRSQNLKEGKESYVIELHRG